MARKPRLNEAGLTYHVWAHGVDGLPIFSGADEKNTAMRLLQEELVFSSWTCLKYVLMTTHYHLVLALRKPTLSSGLQRFNMRYAQWFNGSRTRRGHVFEARFGCRTIEDDHDQLEAMRYVALNPTRAEMCRLPEQYPWSGYGSTIGLFAADPLVDIDAALSPLDGPRARYRTFVEEVDPRVRRSQAA